MSEGPKKLVPNDFPRDQTVGAVSGAQPKLLIRKVGERYIDGLSDDELYARYDCCIDMVRQLEVYCRRKLQERPEWSVSDILKKVRVTVCARTEWDFSAGEVDWMMEKLSARMNASTAAHSPGDSK